MGDPVCYLRFCPVCDATCDVTDDVCPDCGEPLGE